MIPGAGSKYGSAIGDSRLNASAFRQVLTVFLGSMSAKRLLVECRLGWLRLKVSMRLELTEPLGIR
jgi:hypothetical protein